MTAPSEPSLVHGTCIAWPDRHPVAAGVLLRGPSGAGKSDLALRLLDRGWLMVSDDQCLLRRRDDGLLVTAPETIAGCLEIRGLGLLPVPALPEARLALLVDLVAPDRVERLPEPATETLLAVPLPRLALTPFEASAPLKLELAAGLGAGPIMPPP